MNAWILFLGSAIAVAFVVAFAANRWLQPPHNGVDLEGLELPRGLVVFTSTDCSDCAALMQLLRGRSVPIREITFELEPGLFERAGVEGVPLTVAVDGTGRAQGQIAGLPRSRALDRLIRSIA